MIEAWKDIPGYKGLYMASNLGQVRNRHGKILKPNLNSRDYVRYELKDKHGKRKNHMAARLILLSFKGKPKHPDYNADHISGDKLDNSLSNLRWLSPRKNQVAKVKRLKGHCGGTKVGNKYVVAVREGSKCHYAGSYTRKRDANKAYKSKCRELGLK